MYQCKKCGKTIYYESEYCSKCLEEINATKKQHSPTVKVEETPKRKKQKGSVMEGFGSALTGSILGGFVFALFFFSIIVASYADSAKIVSSSSINIQQLMNPDIIYVTRDTYESLQFGGWFLWVFGWILTIPSVFLGIVSIKRYIHACRTNRKKTIPAFVLGIETLAGTSTSIFYAYLAYSILTIL